MTSGWQILAETDIGGLINVVVMLILVGVLVAAKAGEKYLQKYASNKEQQARQREQARGRSDIPPQRDQPARTSAPQRQTTPGGAQREYLEQRRQAAYRRELPRRQEDEREIFAGAGVFSAPPAPRPKQAQRPAPARAAAVEAQQALWQRLGASADAAAEQQPAATLVDLSDPARARAAIVFHEILSPPKGLRRAPEMWDA